MQRYREPLDAAVKHAFAFLDSLETRPVRAREDNASLLARLARPLENKGVAAEQVVGELVRAADPGLVASAGGRFFAWVVGGALPSALAADWLVSTWDQNAALCATGPSAAIVEQVAGEWLKEILGLPATASFAFVTGCQMAHVTCLAAARQALLDRAGWNVSEQGMAGAPAIRIISSDQRHGSFERAVRLLGFGAANAEYLPPGADGTLEPAALEAALTRNSAPAIVLLQAGEINTGIFDPFAELIPIARRHGAWVHVDGAFGLWAAASPRYRHFVAGVSGADSWATDGHKWLNVPQDCGYAFVAHPEPHRRAMSHRAAYLTHDTDVRDQLDWNPDWSRRARGFATYAAFRELGRDGVAALIERCCQHTRALAEGIGALPGAQLLWRPLINQALVRFLDPAGADHDRRTDEVIAAIVASGEAYFSGTTWRGMRAMRISVCNWRTTGDDVSRTIHAVVRVLGSHVANTVE